jgi:antitoxin CptB
MLNKRKRLIWLADHRGTKEADILVSRFVTSIIDDVADDQLDEFEAFLQIPDAILMDWAFGRREPESDQQSQTVKRFLQFYKVPT